VSGRNHKGLTRPLSRHHVVEDVPRPRAGSHPVEVPNLRDVGKATLHVLEARLLGDVDDLGLGVRRPDTLAGEIVHRDLHD
jgi:hypothetical protein